MIDRRIFLRQAGALGLSASLADLANAAGIDTIVDCTTADLGRDVRLLPFQEKVFRAAAHTSKRGYTLGFDHLFHGLASMGGGTNNIPTWEDRSATIRKLMTAVGTSGSSWPATGCSH